MTLFQFYFIEFSLLYILLSWAIYLPFRGQQLYFGALYSMCLGGYLAAYTALNWGWPFWLILIAAIVLCILFSLIPAFKLASLGGFPMLFASMAILFVVQTAIRNIKALGSTYGLFNLPHVPSQVLLSVTFGITLVIGFGVYRLDHSHIGRAMDAIYFDRDVAATLGIDVNRLSIQLQVISSAIGGICGVLYAFILGGVFPEGFGFFLILYVNTILVFGGIYTMWGIIIASPVLWGISQFLPEALKEYSIIVYSILLIIVLLLRPSGIIDRKTEQAVTTGSRALLRRFAGFLNHKWHQIERPQ